MRRWQADLTLAGVTLIWGSTFVVVQNALDAVSPLTFIAWRFILAAVVLGGIFHRRMRDLRRADVWAGIWLGVFLTGGYVFQTIGLQTTSSAKAAFITGLSVVMVPVLATFWLRKPPGRAPVVGIVLATVGLAALTLERDLSVQRGDLWVLACALMFALHIVGVSHFSPQHDTIRLTVVQIGVVAALSTGAAFIFERPTLALPADAWAAIAFTGVAATALVFSLQVHVQRFTTPTHTALLFSLEPVFAAFFAWLLAGELLGPREWIGCGLILGGMLVAELGGGGETVSEPAPLVEPI